MQEKSRVSFVPGIRQGISRVLSGVLSECVFLNALLGLLDRRDPSDPWDFDVLELSIFVNVWTLGQSEPAWAWWHDEGVPEDLDELSCAPRE